MKKISILVAGLFMMAYAQTGNLKGVVKDSTGATIAFASIALYQGDSLIYGLLTDTDGKYIMMGVKAGTYDVMIGSISYKTKLLSDLVISPENMTVLDAELDPVATLELSTYTTTKVATGTTGGVHFHRYRTTWRGGGRGRGHRSVPRYYSDGDSDGKSDGAYKRTTSKTDIPKGNNKGIENKLTAGEISDFTKWDDWQKLLDSDFKAYSDQLKISTGKRFTVEVYDPRQNPIPFASVNLFSGTRLIWQTITDNTGKAELWTGIADNLPSVDNFKIQVDYQGKSAEIEKPKEFSKGINSCTMDIPCNQSTHGLEIAMVVDATGSMDDEINYLKEDLADILTKSKKKINGELTIASVFYRDKGEDYLTRESNFTSNISDAVKFISQQSADGGGDFPEAVEAGLEVAIDKLKWTDKENTKIMFILLDAPPHMETASLVSIKNSMVKASSKGIRIVPVICSGADKHLEYLMRCMALYTNGTYIFLTDHSGIGGTHLKPSTDKYDVYTMNTLMTNIIDRFTMMPSCEAIPDSVALNEDLMTYLDRDEDEAAEEDTIKKKKEKKEITVTVMPNPFDNQTNIAISDLVTGQIHIYDMNGKLLISEAVNDIRNYELNMEQFSRGTYFIILEVKGEKVVKKIIKS